MRRCGTEEGLFDPNIIIRIDKQACEELPVTEKSVAGVFYFLLCAFYLLISATYRTIADKPVSFAYNVIRSGKGAVWK